MSTGAERRLTAIVIGDVVGYSRLVELDEGATLAALHEMRRTVVEPLVDESHGRIIKWMGDGFLAEFASVVDAVAFAAAVQRRLGGEQAGIEADRRLQMRLGVNLGDVVVEGDDLLGDGVNVAARLEQICPPGSVLISGTAYDHMKGKLDLAVESLGLVHLRNMAEPIRAYALRLEVAGSPSRSPVPRGARRPRIAVLATAGVAIALSIAAAAYLFESAPEAGKPMIAVLPFDDYGSPEGRGRWADGLTEDIITDLARFPEFEVIARNTSEAYRDRDVDARVVGRELNVAYVLEGSVQEERDLIRVTAQLIDASDGHHVWSRRWDRPVGDMFAVQSEIAEQVANHLGGGAGLIQASGRASARRKPPADLSAYELYLLGTERIEGMTRPDIEEAIRLLSQAVERDPGFARAWVELFHAHAISSGFGIVDFDTAQAKAYLAAERAVQLDPNDAEAHAVYGSALGYRNDFVRAKAEFDIALGLSPNNFEILVFYAAWSPAFGELERGLEAADRAVHLNPAFPPWAAGALAGPYFVAGRDQQVIELLAHQTRDNLDTSRWAMLVSSLHAVGRTDEAEAALKQALERFPDLTVELVISEGGLADEERQRLIDGMRAAGFPACAKPEDAARFADPRRLPECET